MWFSLQSGDGHGPWFGDANRAPDDEVEDLSGCGLNLFLASLSMLFGAALLGAILVRADQARFEATIDAERALGLGVATLLLVAAERSMARRGVDVRRALRGGLAFGVLFLVTQAWNWRSLSRDGFGIDSGTLEAVLFYMLTILHALHVVGGLVALVVVARRGASRRGLALALRYWRYLGVWWVILLTALAAF